MTHSSYTREEAPAPAPLAARHPRVRTRPRRAFEATMQMRKIDAAEIAAVVRLAGRAPPGGAA